MTDFLSLFFNLCEERLGESQKKSPIFFTRRELLKFAFFAFPLAPVFHPSILNAGNENEEFDWNRINPYGPLANYQYLLRLWNPGVPAQMISRLWKEYEKNRNPDHGEWALIFSYHWWRMTPLGEERKRVAHLSRLMSEKYLKNHPDLPAGYLWLAVHTGMEALSIGILNALQFIPTYRRSLEEVIRRFPDYFFGGAYTLLAKGYLKLPPFPLSIGNLDLAEEYLEKARPYQERKIAFWYLVYAELKLLREGEKGAERMIERMKNEVIPRDAFSLYSLISSLHDAEKLLDVVKKSEYDRYQWDPLLFPIDLDLIRGLEKRYLR